MRPDTDRSVVVRVLAQLVERAPSRHRDLLRGMTQELEAITDPRERRRFTVGAFTTVGRVMLVDRVRRVARSLGRLVGTDGHPAEHLRETAHVPNITTRRLVLLQSTKFLLACSLLTLIFGSLSTRRMADGLRMGEAGSPTVGEIFMLTIPFTLALTIPIGLFIAVLSVFARLAGEGALTPAPGSRWRLPRNALPVLGIAAIATVLTFGMNTLLVPRANERIAARVYERVAETPAAKGDRAMTLPELRAAAHQARQRGDADDLARAAQYEVEVHKKIALAASCLVLALLGAVLGVRVSRGGIIIVASVGLLVILGYYSMLIFGETLADRQRLSPAPAMWLANGIALTLALLLARRRRSVPMLARG